jgi:hypothetical protein
MILRSSLEELYTLTLALSPQGRGDLRITPSLEGRVFKSGFAYVALFPKAFGIHRVCPAVYPTLWSIKLL